MLYGDSAETLRMACVPEDLTTLWLGHSKKTVTDFYAVV
jgi:hypothetical protein